TPDTRAELLVERACEVAQRSRPLVAVEAEVAAADVLLGETTLAGSRDAHDADDVGVRGHPEVLGPSRARAAERAREHRALVSVQLERRGARRRARRLRPPGTRDRDHHG